MQLRTFLSDVALGPTSVATPRAAEGKPPGRLSPRERQILDLVVGGKSHKEIAFDLGIKDATVRVLHARAMKKVGRTKRPRGTPRA